MRMSKSKNELSKEQLLAALQRKRECNARAQKIVESLMEQVNVESEFLEKLFFINACHYEDIVDERHILLYCGYPLCSKTLENIPSQQYKISMATKKVYDITTRKKFCSTHCFKASEYIRSQMLTSPLWLRNTIDPIQFKLLPSNS